MLFFELRFLLFFGLVFGLVWSLRSNRQRKFVLLLASYCFYAAWDWRFLSLILASTLIDYVAALRLDHASERARRSWLLVSLVANLGILGFFKYYAFFVESAAAFLALLGLKPHLPTLELVLPVGISFYTFQSMSYTIDVYRGSLEPRRSLLDVALFVGFFPQLVAGPIVRAREFLPQLERTHSWRDVVARDAIALFLIGWFKKVYVADGIAELIDPYFANPAAYDAVSAWVCAPLYAVQIYCDFSGYSDMAIGLAALLGYRLPRNFDFPYFADDIADFWRRWHISLSSWLRDYLYISLGGNRGTPRRTLRNLMLTMLIGGLWHGAAWNFVLWGALHGTALCAERIITSRREVGSPRLLAQWVAMPLTFLFVVLCWVVFRAQSIHDVQLIWSSLLFLAPSGERSVDISWSLVWLPLVCLHLAAQRRVAVAWWNGLPAVQCAALLGVVVAFGVWLHPVHFKPFIYFQF